MAKTLKKRRKEGKTDYAKRLKMLKSEKPRVVFRKTNRYILAQYISSREAKDRVGIGVTSKELLRYGWPKEAEGSLKSVTAAYLTGFLIGEKIKKKKLENPILDMGMYRNLYKTKVYAFLKGLIDSGIKMKFKEEIFPEEERIKGKNLKNKIPFEEIKNKIEKERKNE
jgi:large subunit ribosomal protein L18